MAVTKPFSMEGCGYGWGTECETACAFIVQRIGTMKDHIKGIGLSGGRSLGVDQIVARLFDKRLV